MIGVHNCSSNNVTQTVEIDPQSSTFAFNWFLRVNGSTKNVSKQDSLFSIK